MVILIKFEMCLYHIIIEFIKKFSKAYNIMTKSEDLIKKYKENSEYTHGFVTDIETIEVPRV